MSRELLNIFFVCHCLSRKITEHAILILFGNTRDIWPTTQIQTQNEERKKPTNTDRENLFNKYLIWL